MGRKQESDQHRKARHRVRRCRAGLRRPLSLTIPDRVVDGELRYRTIGTALNGVVLVAHTLPEVFGGVELIRIISARYATSSERKAYEEGEY
jgi:uncharacterized protein